LAYFKVDLLTTLVFVPGKSPIDNENNFNLALRIHSTLGYTGPANTLIPRIYSVSGYNQPPGYNRYFGYT
jgi:hypothetical protein